MAILYNLPSIFIKNKIKKIESQILESLPEYENRQNLENELKQCVKNNDFFIEAESENETKIIFNLKTYCIVYYKSKTTTSILKLKKDESSSSKEDLSEYTQKMIENIVASVLKDKDLSKSSQFVKEVRHILNNSFTDKEINDGSDQSKNKSKINMKQNNS